VTNLQFFNLSTTPLTPIEKVVLGLGPKFLPLPRYEIPELIIDTTNRIDTLHRRLSLALFFGHSSSDFSDIIPTDETKVPWTPPPQPYDNALSSYQRSLYHTTFTALTTHRSFFSSNDSILLDTLTSLAKNKHITIKPADKNLGLVVMNTSDYKLMCLKHLDDRSTYRPTDTYNPNQVFASLRQILNTHHCLYDPNTPTPHTLTKLAASLLQLQNNKSLRIAPFYTLPKVHKTTQLPIPGRPIISSNSTPTYHTSVYLDKELQPVLKLLNTVCTSSRTLMSQLHNFTVPTNSVFLCADITALYPNIPIDIGISTVKEVLTDLNFFTPTKLNFLMKLLEWVLRNNYCTFDNTTYLQLKGTAMGTPVAVTYSNIFLYGLEKRILPTIPHRFFTRYIDDVFAIFPDSETAHLYVTKFNSLVPSIKFEAITVSDSGIMLDLEFKFIPHPTLHDTLKIKHKIYQKPINIYQYIPTISRHNPSIFHNFVLQELKRYRLACTDDLDYTNIATDFRIRLCSRGYPTEIFEKAFPLVPPRHTLLAPLLPNFKSLIPIHKPKRPLITLCIQPLDPPVKWSHLLALPLTLTDSIHYQNAYQSPQLLVGTKNPPSIGSYLIRSLYKDPTAL
jgi:hypothetical protein